MAQAYERENRELDFGGIPLYSAPMNNTVDMSGLKFGRLTVERRAGSRDGFAMWACRCQCGRLRDVAGYLLRRGAVNSCGCLRIELGHKKNLTHGMKGTPEWRAWSSMKNRCLNQANHAYARYGGRGITVCKQWQGKRGFEKFLSDMGRRPDGKTLDRVNNEGNYDPTNCQWATRQEQSNNARSNRRLTAFGETKTMTQWARSLGMSKSNMWRLLGYGKNLEVIIQERRG